MKNEDTKYMRDFLLINKIATRQEINLVTRINQFDEKTLTAIIECRTGYNFKEYSKTILKVYDWKHYVDLNSHLITD